MLFGLCLYGAGESSHKSVVVPAPRRNGRLEALQIQPVRKLEDECAVLADEMTREIVFRVDDIEIRSGLIPPLKPDVQIHVVEKIVVLIIGGEK